MFGISRYGAFCVAVLLFLMLPWPGTFAGTPARAHRGMARLLDRLAGVFLGAFGIRLALSK